MSKARKVFISIFLISTISIGIFLRLYKIDFGLPYNFIGDETDIHDAVIKFSLNYKFMLANGSLNDFAPDSYVYGMFPTYFLTLCTMVLNKFASIFSFHIDIDSYHIYMRIITSIFSLSIPLFAYLIYKELFKKSKGSLMILFLTFLNWKLVVHSRYLNQDIYLTSLFTTSLYFLIKYLNSKSKKVKTLSLILSSVFFGFAVGTKIIGLISLAIIIPVIFTKGKFKDIILFSFFIILSFAISNPFSMINFNSFISRVITMKTREAGVVFSSVDQNPFKYIFGLSNILTPPVFIISLISIIIFLKGKFKDIKLKRSDPEILSNLLLIGNFFIYLIFFSLNKRLVERWMLPIIPILCIYASYGIRGIKNLVEDERTQKILIISLTSIFLISYSFNALILYKQIKLGDTRILAYEWTKEYINKTDNGNPKILVYTNKGRDPFIRIGNCDVKLFKVYESGNAQDSMPVDPKQYDFIVTYSGMERNYENPYVAKNYPQYSSAWTNFQEELDSSGYFNLIKKFKTTEINLMGLSDIYIYERIK